MEEEAATQAQRAPLRYAISGLHVPGNTFIHARNSATPSSSSQPETRLPITLDPHPIPSVSRPESPPHSLLSASRVTTPTTSTPSITISSFSTEPSREHAANISRNASTSLCSVLERTGHVPDHVLRDHPMPSRNSEAPDALRLINDSAAETPQLDTLAAEGLDRIRIRAMRVLTWKRDQLPNRHRSDKDAHIPFGFSARLTKQSSISRLQRKNRAGNGRSHVYAAESFWVPNTNPYFHLHKPEVLPDDLFYPTFFLWDPENLLNTGIACPCCGSKLNRGGIIKRPRRIVDIDDTFWIIGYTYECKGRCSTTKEVSMLGCTDYLSAPPRARSSISSSSYLEKRVVTALHLVFSGPAFKVGWVPTRLQNMFRMQHLRRYDELRLQYLHRKASSINLPGRHTSPSYHSKIALIKGSMALYLVANGCATSSSTSIRACFQGAYARLTIVHKLAKHVFKVDGVPIFTALLTVTNEKGEIRVCVFVATKSHSQFTEALKKMSESLETYGHEQPEVFYTDNMSDKAMLEEIFQSLLADIVAVEKYSDLPTYTMEETVAIKVLDTVAAIDNTVRAIMEDLPLDGGYLAVGFDSEWNVETAETGHVVRRGSTAVIQIAYQNNVYILPIGEILAAGFSGDLRQLETASGQPRNSFIGGIDLATFAKTRFLISNARVSLADLTAQILHLCLPKNRAERISANWSDRDLSDAQIQYAACGCARLAVSLQRNQQNTYSSSSIPDAPIGTPVVVLNETHAKIVARGVLAASSTASSVDGIRITPTRTVIEVGEVLVPRFIMTQHNKRTLKSFGQVPFDVLPVNARVLLPVPHHNHYLQDLDNDGGDNNRSIPELADAPDTEDVDAVITLGDLLRQCDLDTDPEAIAESLGERDLPMEAFARLIRSRVLKDAFHLLDMIYISRVHGLRVPFAQAFRDALFIPHPDDKAKIEAWLTLKGLKWDDLLRFKSSWLWRHCRRTIPLQKFSIHSCMMFYSPGVHLKMQRPVYPYSTHPPGVSFTTALDWMLRLGTAVVSCIRGTNMTEGGVHTHLRSRLPTSGVSVRHMRACLLDFILRHNLLVGTFNSTGQKYTGHDSIWLMNEIQELEITLSERYPNTSPGNPSWINGNLYQPTTEQMGIMRIPDAQKQSFLARLQGTKKAVLPLHTAGERQLFSELMKTCEDFTSTTDVFYKLSEQLTAYYNGDWKSNSDTRLSLSLAFKQTQPSRSAFTIRNALKES
ncbi:hypothetical protein BDZ89DRAFT_1149038 [Hymenopellis radicata]|nr:hypothetical protein BDZ89DRAFT_1149038 [Hymenopellis radicata]